MPPTPTFNIHDFFSEDELIERWKALDDECVAFTNYINRDQDEFVAEIHYPNLIAAHKNIWDDVALFKFHNAADPEVDLLNAVKRAAFAVKWLTSFKPLQIQEKSPGSIVSADSMLWNETFAIQWAFVNLGYELHYDEQNKLFMPSPEKLADLIRLLAFGTLPEEGWVAIFQLFFDLGRGLPLLLD